MISIKQDFVEQELIPVITVVFEKHQRAAFDAINAETATDDWIQPSKYEAETIVRKRKLVKEIAAGAKLRFVIWEREYK